MKLYVIAILVLAALAVIGGGGYALHNSWYSEGYNKRVGEESAAYKYAEDKGRHDQEAADANTIAQLQDALAQANKAAADRQQDLDAASDTLDALKRRLAHDQDPDARRWLDAALPCSLQQPPACPSAAAGSPSH